MHRRSFISGCLSCSAHVLGLAHFAPSLLRSAFGQQQERKVLVEEKWGRLEEVSEGVLALISTPFSSRNFTTVCNGGLVVGDKGILAIESFMQPKGATWLAEQSKKLMGKWPTDIVSTHFHGDHTSGHKGYFVRGNKPNVWLTEFTRKSAEKSFADRKMDSNDFENVSVIDEKKGAVVDLGNRKVMLVNRSGHTNSDVTIEVVDPKVVWCGDLFFNRMFPNYGDAIPSRLEKYLESITAEKDVTYVPGHGPVADLTAMKQYKSLLRFVREAATDAFKAGDEIEASVKSFKLPDSLSEWAIWSPDNAKRAYVAWYRELKNSN